MQQPPWMTPPPPKKPWARTTAGLVVIVTSVTLVIFLALAALIIAVFPRTPSTSAVFTPATATALAAATGPQPIDIAVIGGTEEAFTNWYGAPDGAPDGAPSYRTTVGGVSVSISLDALSAGRDGQQRVSLMSLADPNGRAWNAATSAAVVAKSLPPDARHIRDDQTPDVGTLHVEQSADLAATFPASAFTNSGQGGGLEPPGTFSYTCDAPGTVGCTISLGE